MSRDEVERLKNRRSEIEKERSAISEKILTLRTQLHLLQRQEKAAEEEAKRRSTLWGWIFRPELSDKEKSTEELAGINRQAAQRIYQARIQDLDDKQSAKGVLCNNLGQSLEKQLRQSSELRAAIDTYNRNVATAKEARARANNLAKEQQRQNEKHRKEEKHQKERNEPKSQPKARQTPTDKKGTSQDNQQHNCTHQCFWEKEEGQQTCEECFFMQKRFIFRCPGCMMVACASCRRRLRGR